MIKSKKEYRYYLEQDSIALGIDNSSKLFRVKEIFAPNYIHRFQKLLRKLEYIKNCKEGFFNKFIHIYYRLRFRKLSIKLGFSIPPNVFGPGLAIVHYGTIVVNSNARVGANCRIHPSTCIGASGGNSEAPQIGDNCYIAPGVKIYGEITLNNNIAIAANAAVGSSFDETDILIGGVPAKKINSIKISKIIKHI